MSVGPFLHGGQSYSVPSDRFSKASHSIWRWSMRPFLSCNIIALYWEHIRMVLDFFLCKHYSCQLPVYWAKDVAEDTALFDLDSRLLPFLTPFFAVRGNLGFAEGSNGRVRELSSGRGLVVDRTKLVFQSPYMEYQNKQHQLASMTNGSLRQLRITMRKPTNPPNHYVTYKFSRVPKLTAKTAQ